MSTINNRFVHLTYQQAASSTLFMDTVEEQGGTNYYQLDGQTADEAELVQYSGSHTDYTLISKEAIVFVDFPDGTTGIITHLKFYSKVSELSNSGIGIKVLYTNDSPDSPYYEQPPTESSEDLGVQDWDVVALVSNYTGVLSDFKLLVCTSAYSSDDGSGNVTYYYSWVPVYQWNTADWANVQSNMTASN